MNFSNFGLLVLVLVADLGCRAVRVKKPLDQTPAATGPVYIHYFGVEPPSQPAALQLASEETKKTRSREETMMYVGGAAAAVGATALAWRYLGRSGAKGKSVGKGKPSVAGARSVPVSGKKGRVGADTGGYDGPVIKENGRVQSKDDEIGEGYLLEDGLIKVTDGPDSVFDDAVVDNFNSFLSGLRHQGISTDRIHFVENEFGVETRVEGIDFMRVFDPDTSEVRTVYRVAGEIPNAETIERLVPPGGMVGVPKRAGFDSLANELEDKGFRYNKSLAERVDIVPFFRTVSLEKGEVPALPGTMITESGRKSFNDLVAGLDKDRELEFKDPTSVSYTSEDLKFDYNFLDNQVTGIRTSKMPRKLRDALAEDAMVTITSNTKPELPAGWAIGGRTSDGWHLVRIFGETRMLEDSLLLNGRLLDGNFDERMVVDTEGFATLVYQGKGPRGQVVHATRPAMPGADRGSIVRVFNEQPPTPLEGLDPGAYLGHLRTVYDIEVGDRIFISNGSTEAAKWAQTLLNSRHLEQVDSVEFDNFLPSLGKERGLYFEVVEPTAK